MSLAQRLDQLESSALAVPQIAVPEPAICVGCHAVLEGFIEPYGPPNWSRPTLRCPSCEASRMRELLQAMEEAEFSTPDWAMPCRAGRRGVSEPDVRERAHTGESSDGRWELDAFLVQAACVLASDGMRSDFSHG